MSPTTRRILFLAGAAGLGVLLLWALAGLPDFGHYRGPYGDVVDAVVTNERHVPEAVGAITFDYRGVDTLGEEVILFAAVAAVAIIVRQQRDEREEEPHDGAAHTASDVSEMVRVVGLGLLPVTVLAGLYLVGHGHLSPGGGFQGGVVIASGLLLLQLAGDYRALRTTLPVAAVEPAEALGMGGYVVIGLVGLVVGVTFLDNVFPLGTLGRLTSGGMLPFLNTTVGLEVAAGMLLVLHELFEQLLVLRRRREGRG